MGRKILWSLALMFWLAAAGLEYRRADRLESVESEREGSARSVSVIVNEMWARSDHSKKRSFIRLLQSHPQVAYLAASDFRSGRKSGAVSKKHIRGVSALASHLRAHGEIQTLAHLEKPGKGFAGEYLDVYSVVFMPERTYTDRTPLGTVKIGIVIPGYPFGSGYRWLPHTLLAAGVLLFAFGAFAARSLTSDADRGQAVPADGTAVFPTDEEERAELEALDDFDDDSATDTTAVTDEEGRRWQLLFNGEDLSGWEASGVWYVSNDSICGQPWGASLVSEKDTQGRPFHFAVSAKTIAGADGFILLFTCCGKSLAWVLGGWGNTRSEVGGYAETATPGSVDRLRWYSAEVRVGTEAVEGWLDGRKLWSLKVGDVIRSSPDVGFRGGIGIAVWNTVAKFDNPRLCLL